MKRRDILKRAPSLLALPVVGIAAPAAAQTETPVVRAYREWKAASDDLKDPKWDALPVDVQDRRCEWVCEMQNAIMDLPAQDCRDFILKVMAYTYFGEHGMPDHNERPDIWAEAEALTAA